MIELGNKVRLTRSELAILRKGAARYGFAINRVETVDEYEAALVKASSPALLEDLMEALETGSSRLIREEVDYEELLSE